MDEDDNSKMLQQQSATILQITKNKFNNNDDVTTEKALGLRTKSIFTQVSISTKSNENAKLSTLKIN